MDFSLKRGRGAAHPDSQETVEVRQDVFRMVSIRCRDANLAPNMFESFVECGRKRLLAEEHGEVAAPEAEKTLELVDDGMDGQLFLDKVGDFKFMLSLNKRIEVSKGSTISRVGVEEPATLLQADGYLPIGFARDAACGGRESLFILVRSSARTKDMPFLPFDVSTNMQRFLGLFGRTRRPLRLVLVWIPQDILNRVINHVYFNAPLVHDADYVQRPVDGPLSIDVQADDDPIIRQSRVWIKESIFRHASDIHVEPMEGRGRIRIRVHGVMEYLSRDIPLDVMNQFVTWVKARANMDISDNRRPLDGSIRLSYTDSGKLYIVDVRISTVPVVYGQKMVLRLLDPDILSKRAKLGLEGTILDTGMRSVFENALHTRDGIVLVTGPTGSGKTTTLNVSLLYLLRKEVFGDTKNIVTIEDPVEYAIPGANQTQVNEKAGVTFAATLRSLLRQDPDIVLVGEIRDSETAKIAVQAALTGHLILATLHTNDALGSVSRLVDLGITRFLIGSTLRLVQAQRLVRSFCDSCGGGESCLIPGEKVRRDVNASRLKPFVERLAAPSARVFRPAGCIRCNGTGYNGRLAVMEMASSSPELVAAIEDERLPPQELVRIASRYSGFRPMIENAVDFVVQGRTSIEEVAAISLRDASGEEAC